MTTDALIIKGDCLNVMAGLPAASIDAIVTDPPYGLSFMGKDWDKGVPGESFWREALRVAKPGCHLLAAGGSRTYHRLTCAIEDAGWEIRDCIIWMYGSGFPKSHDVSKAIDKAAGAKREVIGQKIRGDVDRAKTSGVTMAAADANKNNKSIFGYGVENVTLPATEAARQWQGWGTALKPAFEPFILARKPLDGTVAENVQKYGCGGLNVDGCRVGTDGGTKSTGIDLTQRIGDPKTGFRRNYEITKLDLGRWPANVIHDGSDEVVGVFPHCTGKVGMRGNTGQGNAIYGKFNHQEDRKNGVTDSGSASRFFYCAKASPSEREEGLNGLQAIHRINGNKWTDLDYRVQRGERPQSAESGPRTNHHPTVKPVDLMKYLCRLITPPGGLILDPFCGSGSTGVAAMREGFNFIGIELNADYAEIARRRIDHERNKTPLFSNVI